MTWDQYQLWRQEMQGHIDRKVESMRLTGGSNVTIQGNFVSLLPVERPEIVAAPKTWDYRIFARIRTSYNGEAMSEWSEWSGAFTYYRRFGQDYGVGGEIIWQSTQLISYPDLTRSFELEFESRGVDTWQVIKAQDIARAEGNLSLTDSRVMDLTEYMIPCRLIIGEYSFDNSHNPESLVREHDVEIRRGTVRRSFSPSQSYTELRPIRVERL